MKTIKKCLSNSDRRKETEGKEKAYLSTASPGIFHERAARLAIAAPREQDVLLVVVRVQRDHEADLARGKRPDDLAGLSVPDLEGERMWKSFRHFFKFFLGANST